MMRRKGAANGAICSVAAVLIVAVSLLYGNLSHEGKKSVASEKHDKPSAQTAIQSESERAVFNFIDVGQGDCTLIESPDGKFMLIDAGTPTASQKILDYLENHGVERLEYLVLTHPHDDHIGSASDVMETFPVGTVLMNRLEATTVSYERTIDTLLKIKTKYGTKVYAPNTGDTYDFDGMDFTFLADGKDETNANDSSLVFRMTYGDCSFMFTGDASYKIEHRILSANSDLGCVLLKCGHHGSSTSSCKDFVKAVKPQYAIISCGFDNTYGHPHVETLQCLGNIGAQILRTDEDGDIVIECDGVNTQIVSPSDELSQAA